jgi:hypothetical protein
MKKINHTWFIEEPFDQEHKEYILLNYLKHISKNLKPENCYSILKSVSKIIRSLNYFKKHKSLNIDEPGLTIKDKKYIKNFNFNMLSNNDKSTVIDTIESSLETLYRYSEIFLEILKTEEEKIKIFRIPPPKSNENTIKSNSGILIIRNMITDGIISYYWQGSMTLKTTNGDKSICILKKINSKNQRFSLCYEFIYHELLENFKEENISPDLHVIEIYENFDEHSEIYKLAKEKFIESVT